jgi:hypothetical protein
MEEKITLNRNIYLLCHLHTWIAQKTATPPKVFFTDDLTWKDKISVWQKRYGGWSCPLYKSHRRLEKSTDSSHAFSVTCSETMKLLICYDSLTNTYEYCRWPLLWCSGLWLWITIAWCILWFVSESGMGKAGRRSSRANTSRRPLKRATTSGRDERKDRKTSAQAQREERKSPFQGFGLRKTKSRITSFCHCEKHRLPWPADLQEISLLGCNIYRRKVDLREMDGNWFRIESNRSSQFSQTWLIVQKNWYMT